MHSFISGTRIRVQTIVIAAHQWGLSPNQLAEEYELTEAQVRDALGFYAATAQGRCIFTFGGESAIADVVATVLIVKCDHWQDQVGLIAHNKTQ